MHDGFVLSQSGEDGIADRVVNERLMLEADFRLCGMDIHVDVFKGNRDKQNYDWKRSGGKDIPIGLADRVQNDFVAHQPPVDEEEH